MHGLKEAQRRHDLQNGIDEAPRRFYAPAYYNTGDVKPIFDAARDRILRRRGEQCGPVWSEMAESGLYGPGGRGFLGHFWEMSRIDEITADRVEVSGGNEIFTYFVTREDRIVCPDIPVRLKAVHIWRDAETQHIQHKLEFI
jgi:hypothetical protein